MRVRPGKLFLWVVVYPLIPFLVISVGILVYASWPRRIRDVSLPELEPGTTRVTLLAHGKDDSPATWSADLAEILTDLNGATPGFQAIAIDWSAYSASLFRCSLDGRRIGKRLGRELARATQVREVHLIGHSAGSFLIYGLCEALEEADSSLRVHTTYLDPLGIYRGFDWGYGPRHFGTCADLSEAYIDTDDGIPGSNEPLPHAHTFDVTAARPSDFSPTPHLWPVFYYGERVRSGTQPTLADAGTLPPGKSTRVGPGG